MSNVSVTTASLTNEELRAQPVSVSGSVSISNLPATQPVSGSVSVSNLPATQPVSGSVSVSNLPATQAISAASLPLPSSAAQEHVTAASPHSVRISDGAAFIDPRQVTIQNASLPVTGTFWQATQPVSGPLTDTQLRASAVPVSGTFWPATQPVSAASLPLPTGAATSAKQPALGTAGTAAADVLTVQGIASMTALKVDGSAVTQPVSGSVSVSNFPATQPVSGTVTANAGTGTFTVSGTVTANAGTGTMAVSGPLTDTQLRASAVPVSMASLPQLANMSAASSTPTGVVSLGNSLGKTVVMKTGNLVTTATTADQVILTYTVTPGKTFYLEYFDVTCRLTTFAATATFFGSVSLENPSGTKLYTTDLAGTGVTAAPIAQQFVEPIPIPAGTVIRVVCTPSAVTSFTWKANFGGYEK